MGNIENTPWLLFILVGAGFLCCAGLSYYDSALALYVAVAYIALIVFWKPTIGWGLAIFAIPFQNLFGFSSADFGNIRALLLLLLGVRLVSFAWRRDTYRGALVWVLIGFTVLVALHVFTRGTGTESALRDVFFFLALTVIFVISREYGTAVENMVLAQTAMVCSVLVSATVTFLFLYVPLPFLLQFHQPLDNLRLFGVQDNPNALAKLLVPALLFLACRWVFSSRTERWVVPVLLLCTFFAAATGTKSVMVALLTTLLFLLPFFNRGRARELRFWIPAMVVFLGYAIWLVVTGPLVVHHAAERWVARSELNLCYYIYPDPCPPEGVLSKESEGWMHGLLGGWKTSFKKLLRRELRLGESHEMIKQGNKTEYIDRPFSISKIGQRDITWRGGLSVVMAYWAWGIGGPGEWQKHMQKLTGYPFDSPHNSILEVIGGYGILGGLLYFFVIGVFIRNYLLLRNLVSERWQILANEWLFLCAAAVFVIEMVDVLTVFGITIHAIWLWVIVGLQAGLLNTCRNAASSSSCA